MILGLSLHITKEKSEGMNFGDRVELHGDSCAKAKKKKNIRKILINFIVVFVLLVAVFLLVIFSKLFSVENIEIKGSERFGGNEIYSYINGYLGENGFSLILKNNSVRSLDKAFDGRLTELEERLLFEFSYLKTVSVEYDFSNNIFVNVEERNAVLFFNRNDEYVCVDDEGFVAEIMTEAEFLQFKQSDTFGGTTTARGLVVDEYMRGKKLSNDGLSVLYDTIALCTAVNENNSLKGKLEYVDITVEDNILLFALPSLVVEFGSFDGMYDKILRLAAIFDKGYDGSSDGTIVFNENGHDLFRPNKNTDDELGDETLEDGNLDSVENGRLSERVG